eukprot:11197855-Lingulodinium_polyedra.AAC.1
MGNNQIGRLCMGPLRPRPAWGAANLRDERQAKLQRPRPPRAPCRGARAARRAAGAVRPHTARRGLAFDAGPSS